jgi:hypothetical protein
MSASFKNHQLADYEKLWLQEIYKSEDFDPRIAKVVTVHSNSGQA